MADQFGIKDGYKPRLEPVYYMDEPTEVVYQPDVYAVAISLARHLGAKYIIDIGSGNGLKLKPAENDFSLMFIDFGANLKLISNNLKDPSRHQFIEVDLEQSFLELSEKILKDSVVICSDVIEHLVDPTVLIRGLKHCAGIAPLVLISTPDRERTHGSAQMGPPPNEAHVREWSRSELDSYLKTQGFDRLISGYTRSSNYTTDKQTIIQLAGQNVSKLFPGQRRSKDERIQQPDLPIEVMMLELYHT